MVQWYTKKIFKTKIIISILYFISLCMIWVKSHYGYCGSSVDKYTHICIIIKLVAFRKWNFGFNQFCFVSSNEVLRFCHSLCHKFTGMEAIIMHILFMVCKCSKCQFMSSQYMLQRVWWQKIKLQQNKLYYDIGWRCVKYLIVLYYWFS